jgi:sestrin
MGELVHAMLIICTFNSLAGIIHGCGVANEVDFAHLTVISEDPEEEEIKEGIVMDDTNKLAELLKSGFNAETEEHQVQLFVKAEIPDTPCAHNQQPTPTQKGGYTKTCANYLGEFSLQHVDFDVHSKTYSIFKVQDYCWKEDGFELVRRFLPGGATLLDEEFNHIYTMTYNMFNQSTNVDTLPFRRAIWQYVQRVKGMFHDDYNYQEVNMFLNRSTKAYVKKIVCHPETITKSDYVNVGLALRPDEKVHAALLAVESAKQSTLLYGIHAIMQHIT